MLEAVSGPLATAMVDLHAAVQSSLLPKWVLRGGLREVSWHGVVYIEGVCQCFYCS